MTDGRWDREVDVVVVGTGAAGSAAAVEAAEGGARVLAVDRWGEGGASARSGGVVYAGGGTPQQRAAGFSDTAEEMEQYLALEEGVPSDDPLLRRFCESSRADLAWLAAHGVPIAPGFEPAKAIVPTDDGTGLYFSGNEKHFRSQTPAVPRGHRVAGTGMTGYALVDGLHRAARASGVLILDHARLLELVTDAEGGVVGVELLVLHRDRATRTAHRALGRAIGLAARGLHRVPAGLGRAGDRFEHRRGRVERVRARRGVVLATGGFAMNHSMMVEHAPAYARTMPLGTAGDDGSGIRSATAVGAAVRLMDRCGASRFYAPPLAFCRGVLVDGDGRRVCDESLYAATLSAEIARRGGQAWLVLDAGMQRDAWTQIRSSPTLRGRRVADVLRGRMNHVLFPWLFGPLNLTINARRGHTIDDLARRCGMPAGELAETLTAYNDCAARGGPDPLGKPAELLRPLCEPPFLAVRCGLDGVLFPAPCITLGGLDVDGDQRVRDKHGAAIPGLYAVGRCAAGVASRSYVSGLSLADCIFAGRNAGRALASRVRAEHA